MQIECPHCKRRLEIGDEQAGQVVNCGNCGGQMQVPALSPGAGAGAGAASTGPASPGAPAGGGSLSGGSKACPYCGEMIQAGAEKCRHCGSFVRGRSAGDFVRPRGGGRDRGRDLSGGEEPGLAIATLVIGVVGLLVCGPLAAVALITGFMCMKQHPNMATGHRVMNIIGMVLGGLGLLMLVFFAGIMIFAIIAESV